MIRILVSSNWSGMPARIWTVDPDDTDWPFFQAHTNVGDVLTLRSAGGNFDCTYEVLSKDAP